MITLQKVLEVSTKAGDGIPIAHPAREFLSSLINEPNTVISEIRGPATTPLHLDGQHRGKGMYWIMLNRIDWLNKYDLVKLLGATSGLYTHASYSMRVEILDYLKIDKSCYTQGAWIPLIAEPSKQLVHRNLVL